MDDLVFNNALNDWLRVNGHLGKGEHVDLVRVSRYKNKKGKESIALNMKVNGKVKGDNDE